MAQTMESSNDLPIARLLVSSSFHKILNPSFLLFPGVNRVGSDKTKSHIAIELICVSDVHFHIICMHNGHVFLCDLPKEYETVSGNKINNKLDPPPPLQLNKEAIEPNFRYEIKSTSNISLANELVTFKIEMLTTEERERGPPRYKSRNPKNPNSQSKDPAGSSIQCASGQRGSISTVPDSSRRSRGAPSDGPTQEVPVHDQTDNPDDSGDFTDDDPLPATLLVADVTQPLSGIVYGNSCDYTLDAGDNLPQTFPTDIRSSSVLPAELTATRRPQNSDVAATLSLDQNTQTQVTVAHDAPTQVLEESQSLDPDAATQALDRTLLLDEDDDEDEHRSFDGQGSESAQETQFLPLVAASLDIATEEAPVQGTPPPRSRQEKAFETQSTQQDDAQSTQSPRRSRHPSAELVSQEISQVFSVTSSQHAHTLDRIPATPIDRVPATPVENLSDSKTTRGSMIEDVQSKLESGPVDNSTEQILEEENRVPQTPEENQNQHLAVSDVSTLETTLTSAPQADSLEASLGSASATGLDESHDSGLVQDLGLEATVSVDVETEISIMKEKQVLQALDSDEDEPMSERRQRPADAILEDSQEPVSSSLRLTDESTSSATVDVTMVQASQITRSRSPSSVQAQARPKDRSSKHGMESDAEASQPKPAKLIKVESVDATPGRSTPSRMVSRRSTLERRSTLDMDIHRPVVMMSAPGKPENERNQWKSFIEILGGSYRDQEYKEATVLVFEGKSRTTKLMCAVVRGIPIVTMQWLKDSKAQGRFLPPEDYRFQDPEMEKNYGFNLAKSCELAKAKLDSNIGLFEHYSFFFVVKKGKKQDKVDEGLFSRENVSQSLAPMVEVCGGKLLKTAPKKINDNLIVIGPDPYCEDTQEFVKKGFQVMRKEFLLNSILQQKLDLKAHTIGIESPPTLKSEDDDDSAMKSEPEDTKQSQEDEEDDGDDESSSARQKASTGKGKAVTRPSKTSRSISRSSSSVSAPGGVSSRKASEMNEGVEAPAAEAEASSSATSLKPNKGGRRTAGTIARLRSRASTIGTEDGNESLGEAEASASSTSATAKAVRTVRANKKKAAVVASEIATEDEQAQEEDTSMEKAQPEAGLRRKHSKGSFSLNKVSATDTEEEETEAGGSSAKDMSETSTTKKPKGKRPTSVVPKPAKRASRKK